MSHQGIRSAQKVASQKFGMHAYEQQLRNFTNEDEGLGKLTAFADILSAWPPLREDEKR